MTDRSKCTGCSACASACPQNCITMQTDGEGFLYPEVDENQCIHCGRCNTVCYPEQRDESGNVPLSSWAVMAKDLRLRKESSSGGVFSLLAEETLSAGGVVFGAAMRPDCKSLHHVMIEKTEDIFMLRGSKYLQSDMEKTFCKVETCLQTGKSVLFTGTPCQIDGLKAFLRNDYDNLLCVELICHGVPSSALWRKYVEYLEKKHGAPMIAVNFRSKENGWIRYGVRMEDACHKVFFASANKNPYLRMFLKDIALRPSCYQCASKGLKRNADLTIGDFWGIEKVLPDMNDIWGTSLLLVHSAKGDAALNSIKSRVRFAEVNCEVALQSNPSMRKSAKKNAERASFYQDMNKLSFKQLAKKYAAVSAKERMYMILEDFGLLTAARATKRKIMK